MSLKLAKYLLRYDQLTGLFTWMQNRRGGAEAGDIAGKINRNGYRVIKVDGVSYLAHRLAWFFVYGVIPTGELDHRNRNRDDNRINNLRTATRMQNCQNNGGWSCKRSGLPKGVTFDSQRNKYIARVSIDGRSRNIGRFDSPELADECVQQAARVAYGAFAIS